MPKHYCNNEEFWCENNDIFERIEKEIDPNKGNWLNTFLYFMKRACLLITFRSKVYHQKIFSTDLQENFLNNIKCTFWSGAHVISHVSS